MRVASADGRTRVHHARGLPRGGCFRKKQMEEAEKLLADQDAHSLAKAALKAWHAALMYEVRQIGEELAQL